MHFLAVSEISDADQMRGQCEAPTSSLTGPGDPAAARVVKETFFEGLRVGPGKRAFGQEPPWATAARLVGWPGLQLLFSAQRLGENQPGQAKWLER